MTLAALPREEKTKQIQKPNAASILAKHSNAWEAIHVAGLLVTISKNGASRNPNFQVTILSKKIKVPLDNVDPNDVKVWMRGGQKGTVQQINNLPFCAEAEYGLALQVDNIRILLTGSITVLQTIEAKGTVKEAN